MPEILQVGLQIGGPVVEQLDQILVPNQIRELLVLRLRCWFGQSQELHPHLHWSAQKRESLLVSHPHQGSVQTQELQASPLHCWFDQKQVPRLH